MPSLDVSDVLGDPEFCDDTLALVRRVSTVSLQGLGVLTPQEIPFEGVVTQGGGDVLRQLDIGDEIVGSITVHTTTPLSDGRSGQAADLIRWQGRTYKVTVVSDWSTYGAGFCSAACTLASVNPQT